MNGTNTDILDKKKYTKLANCIRLLSIDAIEKACSGHPGAPLGLADVATILFAKHLKFYAPDPNWPNRDRFILSNGHASMLLYSLLYLVGSPNMSLEEIKSFRQWGSITPGHPERGETPGVEYTTGPLGQGVGMAVGSALTSKLLGNEFSQDLYDNTTWAIVGDGCLMEGVSQEAASFAGHLGLDNLVLLYDSNNISIDGTLDLTCSENTSKKFRSMGWNVEIANGHDYDEIDVALTRAAKHKGQPTIVIFNTIIGYGSPNKQNTSGVHGSPLGESEALLARNFLGITASPFEVDEILLDQWREIGKRCEPDYKLWAEKLLLHPQGNALKNRLENNFSELVKNKLVKMRSELSKNRSALATRKCSQLALYELVQIIPYLLGGSADLSGSNLTQVASQKIVKENNLGRYIHYGVREFAMAAIMNGISGHGGFIPYGGTFLVFSDYARNAIRLSALQKLKVIYVFTHDSIGLGEDGPTHQPIEHLPSLRAIPDLLVIRPCDIVETSESWEIGVSNMGPTALILSRQGVPVLRSQQSTVDENLVAKGGYVISGNSDGHRDVTILSSGTEVHLAVEASKILAEKYNLKAVVVSLPCWELFERQSVEYKRSVLGESLRVSVEAASTFGWGRYLESEKHAIGINCFGKSAPASELYQKFAITSQAVIEKVLSLLEKI